MKRIGLILVVFAFLINGASAGQSLEVGDSAPDFNLVGVSGDEIRLDDYKGKKNVILTFYEDNSWGVCRRQLGQLQKHISDIEKLNAEVIAISTAGNQQDVEKSKRNIEITYGLIPTPNKKVVEEYGLRHDSNGAAYATFIIDTKGDVRFKRVETGTERTSISEIIKELQSIQWCDSLHQSFNNERP